MMRPHVTIKFAATLDGKIAAEDGSSKWISSPEARAFARALRAKCGWVLVGIGTVLRDNPTLKPRRIILDSSLRIPLASKIVKTAGSIETIIVTTRRASAGKIKKLEKRNIKVLSASSLRSAMNLFGKKGIKNILVEGGSGIITSFLKASLVDEIVAIISPKILGSGLNAVGDLGIRNIKGALKLKLKRMKRIGGDVICVY